MEQLLLIQGKETEERRCIYILVQILAKTVLSARPTTTSLPSLIQSG